MAAEQQHIIVDDKEAFVIFPDRSDGSTPLGLTLRVPGVPMIQRILFEQVIQRATSRAR